MASYSYECLSGHETVLNFQIGSELPTTVVCEVCGATAGRVVRAVALAWRGQWTRDRVNTDSRKR